MLSSMDCAGSYNGQYYTQCSSSMMLIMFTMYVIASIVHECGQNNLSKHPLTIVVFESVDHTGTFMGGGVLEGDPTFLTSFSASSTGYDSFELVVHIAEP